MIGDKEKKLAAFDPNDIGIAANQIFGLPFTEEEAAIVLVPIPWDTTVSYGGGCKDGPRAILEASYQIDLYDTDNPKGWQEGIAMSAISGSWESRSQQLRPRAESYIAFLESGGCVDQDPAMKAILAEINSASEELRSWVCDTTSRLLSNNKLVGLVGGDHSTPLGFIDAIAKRNPDFGILQIDAHCDLREAYEGFKYSHASIMWNALSIPQVKKLVQVGIRDYCEAEAQLVERSEGRIRMFSDSSLKQSQYEGRSWKSLCSEIVKELPQNVYISFDIDGLDPKLCPNTGTPVPGGLEFEQAIFIVRELVSSGRNIIGFDLNEVTPGESEWDANVGARILYKLCNFMLMSSTRQD